jgi:hypothetical protein
MLRAGHLADRSIPLLRFRKRFGYRQRRSFNIKAGGNAPGTGHPWPQSAESAIHLPDGCRLDNRNNGLQQ